MQIFYFLALVPLIIGYIIFIKNKEVCWREWLGGSAAAFVLAAIFHISAFYGMTDDIETWSGQVIKTTHHPFWIEKYKVTVHHSSGSGKNRRTWTTTKTRYRNHPEYWDCDTTVDTSPNISKQLHLSFVKKFGNKITTETPWKSGFHSGDRNIYVAYNTTKCIIPVTTLKHWENRIKAAPTVFSFMKIPKGFKGLYEWPESPDVFQSNRLLGQAANDINISLFDQLNARLGLKKKINIIIIGFPSTCSESIVDYQRAKWVGGKKNDLVICYSKSGNVINWCRVFGWTDSELVKRNIETLILNDGVNDALLESLEREINTNYTVKDWNKFDYIKIKPPTWSYFVFIIFMILTQGGFWWWAMTNEYNKDEINHRYRKSW